MATKLAAGYPCALSFLFGSSKAHSLCGNSTHPGRDRDSRSARHFICRNRCCWLPTLWLEGLIAIRHLKGIVRCHLKESASLCMVQEQIGASIHKASLRAPVARTVHPLKLGLDGDRDRGKRQHYWHHPWKELHACCLSEQDSDSVAPILKNMVPTSQLVYDLVR